MITAVVAITLSLIINAWGLLISVRWDKNGIPDKYNNQFQARKLRTLKPRLPRIIQNLVGQWIGIAIGFTVLESSFPIIWPGLSIVLLQFLVIVFMDDLFFYFGHKSFHKNPWLYKKIHSQHHQAYAPVPIEYIYVHPLEQAMGAVGIIAGISSVLLLWGSVSAWTIWLYMTFRVLHEFNIHSGSNIFHKIIPFFAPMQHHDIHHARPNSGNFASIFRYLDILFGTCVKKESFNKKKRATQAPLVRGLPILGVSLQLLKDPYKWWYEQSKKHGNVFRLKIPTDKFTWIALWGKDANELLAKHGQTLFSQERTYPRAKEVLGTNLHPSITEGKLQSHLRQEVASGFGAKNVEPHINQMLTWVSNEVNNWQENSTFNVTEKTSLLGLNCSAIFATGEPLKISSESIRKYATVFTGVIALNWPRAAMRIPSVSNAKQNLDEMIEQTLNQREQCPFDIHNHDRPKDFFDKIQQSTLPNGDALPERAKVIFGQIPYKNMGVYAGRVINQVLYQLVSRKDVLKRIQPEIDRVFSKKEITQEDFDSMIIFKAAVKECLRILPIAVAVQRTVIKPFEFSGYQFEDNDHLFFPIGGIHFDEEHYDKPNDFNLDRFTDGSSPKAFTYNPFGVGHHSCIARRMFESINTIVIGSILYQYELEAPYKLKTIVDALPGPSTKHKMKIINKRNKKPSGQFIFCSDKKCPSQKH